MAIKFSELSPTTTLASADEFAVSITSINASKSISFGDLKNIIVDEQTFIDNAEFMKNALNNEGGIDATRLNGQTGDYYLTWSNVINPPFIPSDLNDLSNDQVEGSSIGGFVKLNPTDQKLVFQRKQGDTEFNAQIITTDNVDEGGFNAYYSDQRVEGYFDANFASYFNKYNVTFDQGNVRDSYFDTVGYATAVTESGETSVIRVLADGQIPGVSSGYPKRSQENRFTSYQPGENVRLYGADSSENVTEITNNLSFSEGSVTVVGFNAIANAGLSTPTFHAVDDVNNVTKAITINNHQLDVGDAVIYNSGGGSALTNLVSGNTYYIFARTTHTVKLAATINAGSAVSIDIGSGSSHTLTPITIDQPYQRITYSVCEWDMTTGKVSPISENEISRNIGVPIGTPNAERPEYLADNTDRILEDFSVENFVKLSFVYSDNGSLVSGVTPGRGVLIYRRVAQVNTIEEQLKGIPKLVAVLGPLELTNNYWIDYFTDDLLIHSGDVKDVNDNSYIPEKTVHFKPNILPSGGGRGWVDATIESVTYENDINKSLSDYIDIKLTSNVIMDSGQSSGVWISHNDTAMIQAAIDTNAGSGRKAIQFNPKNYVTGQLSVPSNFSLSGFAYNTKLTRLPWSGWTGSTASSSGRLIVPQGTALNNTSFVGMDVDGNSINSIGFDDRSDISKNYTIDIGQFSDSVLLDKVRVRRPYGGGVYSPNPSNLKMIACEMVDSCITDRHVFSPLIADSGENLSISSNKFENFSKGSVDVSLTDKGAIEGNIISNCGSGLLVYGSKFLISSPNVLTGPAGEFLPAPDAYNSEFDSINVDLTQASLATGGPTAFESDMHVYQENGQAHSFVGAPDYKIFAVKKSAATGEESIWIEDLRPPTGGSQAIETLSFTGSDIDTSNERITGAHNFVTGDPVKYYTNNGASFSANMVNDGLYYVRVITSSEIELFDSRNNALNGSNAAGRVQFTPADVSTASVPPDITHTLTRNVFLDLQARSESSNPPSAGGFQWNIPADTVRKIKFYGQPYTVDYMRDPTNTIWHRTPAGGWTSTTGDAEHVGLGWSASVTQTIPSSMIVNNAGNPGSWFVEGNDTFYEITVRDYKYLSEGAKVKPEALDELNTHNGFSPGQEPGGPAPDEFGIVANIGAGTEEKVIKIRWPNAHEPTATAGANGILNIENTFVIATGRIK